MKREAAKIVAEGLTTTLLAGIEALRSLMVFLPSAVAGIERFGGDDPREGDDPGGEKERSGERLVVHEGEVVGRRFNFCQCYQLFPH